MKFLPARGLACLLLAGCGGTTPPAPGPAAATFIWQKAERPYVMLAMSSSNSPRVNEQTRIARALYAEPESREQVEQALREIYGELRKDIEETQSDARYRRIGIRIYESDGDVKHDPDAWLSSLEVDPEPEEPLPEFASVEVQWQWRDPAARPSDGEREIEWEYLAGIAEIDGSVPFGVTDSDMAGLDPPGRRAFREQRYAAESQELKRQLAERHNMSLEELQQFLDRMVEWKYGSLAEPPE